MNKGIADYLNEVPDAIVRSLDEEYRKLESRFVRRNSDDSRMKAALFSEAMLRYLEWKHDGSYTPIDDQLHRKSITDEVKNDASMPDGVRFLVRRCSDLLSDIRNKRHVAHLGSVNVEEMDARLMMRVASWSLSEIIREESDLGVDEIQPVIDRLSARRFPLVEEIDGDLIVVAKDLSAREQALVALYHAYPEPISLDELRAAVKYQNVTRFRKMMEDEEDRGVTHMRERDVYLTGAKGVPWVEKNIDLELKI